MQEYVKYSIRMSSEIYTDSTGKRITKEQFQELTKTGPYPIHCELISASGAKNLITIKEGGETVLRAEAVDGSGANMKVSRDKVNLKTDEQRTRGQGTTIRKKH